MYCNVSKYININYESHQVGNLKALSAVVAPAKDGLKFEGKNLKLDLENKRRLFL